MTDSNAHDCQSQRLTFITSMRDHLHVDYCPTGRHLMPAATSKVILYSQTPHGKTLLTHPVAIFANAKDAKAFATYMRLAHRASDVPAAVALDPQTDLTEEGTIRQGTKWSILEVRYAPSPSFPEDEAAEVEPAVS